MRRKIIYKDINYTMIKGHCHFTDKKCGACSICNLRYSVLKEIPTIMHNNSN